MAPRCAAHGAHVRRSWRPMVLLVAPNTAAHDAVAMPNRRRSSRPPTPDPLRSDAGMPGVCRSNVPCMAPLTPVRDAATATNRRRVPPAVAPPRPPHGARACPMAPMEAGTRRRHGLADTIRGIPERAMPRDPAALYQLSLRAMGASLNDMGKLLGVSRRMSQRWGAHDPAAHPFHAAPVHCAGGQLSGRSTPARTRGTSCRTHRMRRRCRRGGMPPSGRCTRSCSPRGAPSGRAGPRRRPQVAADRPKRR